MNYKGTSFKGLKGTYVAGDFLAGGGEGEVYRVEARSDLVIKIYKNLDAGKSRYNSNPRKHQEEKIRIMIQHPVNPYNAQHELCLAWPKDALYDRSGRFVGYVMPCIKANTKMYDACRIKGRTNLFRGYSWKHSVGIALNLAATVCMVHSQGYVIGDMNPNNIVVGSNGCVTLIDTDSFDVTDRSTRKNYKCTVGVGEFLAPELQGARLDDPRSRFSEKTDVFSMAIHIFNLLMNNCHPFNCRNIQGYKRSSVSDTLENGIANGNFFYNKKGTSYSFPKDAPDYYMLPDYIRTLFDRTFTYTGKTVSKSIANRPSAREWYDALVKLYTKDLVSCRAGHIYYKGNKVCPWCVLEARKNGKPVPPGGQNSGQGISSSGQIQKKKSASGWILALCTAVIMLLIIYYLMSDRDFIASGNEFPVNAVNASGSEAYDTVTIDPWLYLQPDSSFFANGQVFPDSASVKISEEDLSSLQKKADNDLAYRILLRYSINEIYARHGYPFDESGLFFPHYSEYAWYNSNPYKDVTDDDLTSREVYNKNLLVEEERRMRYDSNSYREGFEIIDISASWGEARLLAMALGGRLAILDTSENNEKADLIVRDGSCYAYWTGGVESEGQWYWFDNFSLTAIENDNWEEGEPSRSGTGVYLAQLRENGEWQSIEGTSPGEKAVGTLIEYP